jgi:hypothetical protein
MCLMMFSEELGRFKQLNFQPPSFAISKQLAKKIKRDADAAR